jgi:hypothetical protein
MEKLGHEVIGSEHFKCLHRKGLTKKGEGEHCIVGCSWKMGFICDYALTEGSFVDYKDTVTYFYYCPVCGKKIEWEKILGKKEINNETKHN